MKKTNPKKRRVRNSHTRTVLEQRYSLYFRPNPAVWNTEDMDFSLEQPSPVKVVPTEVTYGIADSMFA